MAPPTCAKCAMGPIEYEVNPKNKSPKINKGTRTLALTGMGGKSNIKRALGKRIAKATNTPYKAPDAPTITPLNADKLETNSSLPIRSTNVYERSLVWKKRLTSDTLRPSAKKAL